jgi:hypothetical protein
VDSRGGGLPDAFVAWFEGDGVWLEITEYDNLFTSAVVAEEECRAFNGGHHRLFGIGREKPWRASRRVEASMKLAAGLLII